MITTLPGGVARAASAPVLDVFGVRVRVLAGGAETDGACSIALLDCPPGMGAPRHRHAEAEDLHVIRGTLTVQLGDETLRLGPGDLVHVRPGTIHAFRNATDADVEFLAIETPAGHELFFRDADELARAGRFNPETAAEACRRHGIELL